MLKTNLTKIIANISEPRSKVSTLPTKSSYTTTESLVAAALILTNVSTRSDLIGNSTVIPHSTVLNNNYSKFLEDTPLSTLGGSLFTYEPFNATSQESYTTNNPIFNEEYEDQFNEENIETTLYEDSTTSSNALTSTANESCVFGCVTNASSHEDYSTTIMIDLTQETITEPTNTVSTSTKTTTNEQNKVSHKTTISTSNNESSSTRPGEKYNITQKRITSEYIIFTYLVNIYICNV